MPRRILRSVMRAKKRSTWLSQDELVGVRWTCQRGLFASQLVAFLAELGDLSRLENPAS